MYDKTLLGAEASTEWRERAETAVAAFEAIAREAEWPYKRLTLIRFNGVQDPSWKGIDHEKGEIVIDPQNHDPEAVVHELAHGMHERMRGMDAFKGRLTDKGPDDRNGEQFAQMIRFVVQRRLRRPWSTNQDDEFIKRFDGEWSRFRAWVEDKYTFIVKTPGVCGGKPRIEDHRIRVQDIATMFEHARMSPDEICEQYPSISLSQVHAALSYYYDHYEEIERQLIEDEHFVEQFKRQHPEWVR